MKCLSSPLLQDKSKNKGFPFLIKSDNSYSKPIYSLKNLSDDSKSFQKPLSNNIKRMWIPRGKENFKEASEPRKKVKLDKNHRIDSENKKPASSTEDSVWRIDQASLEKYSRASTSTRFSADPKNPDDQIQIACAKILQELAKDQDLREWKSPDDTAMQASAELYSNLKSQFWVKYNKNVIPKFVLSGLAIEGGTGLDESSFVKLITQPPSTSTGTQKDIHETPVGESHQTSLAPFNLNNKRRTRRPVKLVWSPNALSEEDWKEYLAEISKIVGEKITKEDAVAKHLVKFHGDFDKAIEEVRKKRMFYRNAFRVCQKNLRSRGTVS